MVEAVLMSRMHQDEAVVFRIRLNQNLALGHRNIGDVFRIKQVDWLILGCQFRCTDLNILTKVAW